jgi:hypothetical protein
MLDAKLKLKLLIESRPWESEPDLEEWTDYATGYKCRIKRHPTHLHLNGYVGIPPSHRAFGVGYDDADAPVHGGLTYSDQQEDGYWWFGFDTSHTGDLNIGVILSLLEIHYTRDDLMDYHLRGEYRDFAYVKNEVLCLINFLKEEESRGNSEAGH